MSLLLAMLGLTIPKLIGIVALGVATGILVAKLVQITFTWLTDKIKQKLAKRNVSKVAVGELSKIIEGCHNQTTIDEMMAMQEKGVTHFSVEVQNDGTIDENNGIEIWDDNLRNRQVSDFINRTGEGLVVVNNY